MTTLESGTEASGGGWLSIARTMLRTMLNDAGASSYTNSRLDDMLIASAYLIVSDINFITTYSVNIQDETVSPDPSVTSDDGSDFISLVVLRAACMSDESAFRTAALMQGVQARCGPATLNTSAYGQYLREIFKDGPCKAYDTLKYEYNFGYDGKRVVRAVMGPFVSNTFQPPNGEAGNGQIDYLNSHRNRNSY